MSTGQKKILKKLKKSYKENSKYYAFLADYLFKNGYDQQAQDILEQNNDKYPEYTSGRLVLGEIFYSRKEYLKAEDMFKKVIDINKKSVKALKYLANIESLRKNKKAQFEYLTDALRYDSFDQDAKNFILMYSGMYSDDKVAGSSYFSERMSQLLDKDIVNQAIEGSNTYKSTYDLEELSRIALEEKEKMDKEKAEKGKEGIELNESTKDIDLDLDQKLAQENSSFNKEVELKVENEFKQTVIIEHDRSNDIGTIELDGTDDIGLKTESDIDHEDKVLEEFEKELDDFKIKSSIDIPTSDDISEVFESVEVIEEESQHVDTVEKRIPLKEIFSAANKNIKTMEKYARLLEKVPDNNDFKVEFLLARSSFIKQRLLNEIEYYQEMSEKYRNNPKYDLKLKSFQSMFDTVDDYNLN
ncbi:MAG: hypothetical protein PF574_10220 [Candidatus Delongbacteria bacterium]|jgi:hypothetical protein|nr:hypothetical protein [Candidatus Delongbacteria bacterium]